MGISTIKSKLKRGLALTQKESGDLWEYICSLEKQQCWIPCSEMLPKANGRYLVTRGLNACGALWKRVYILNYSDLMGLKSERI